MDQLVDDEEFDIESMNSITNRTHTKKHVSSELDTDQGEGITQKLKFAAKQLNDGIHWNASGILGEFSELPTTPDHDLTLVNPE